MPFGLSSDNDFGHQLCEMRLQNMLNNYVECSNAARIDHKTIDRLTQQNAILQTEIDSLREALAHCHPKQPEVLLSEDLNVPDECLECS